MRHSRSCPHDVAAASILPPLAARRETVMPSGAASVELGNDLGFSLADDGAEIAETLGMPRPSAGLSGTDCAYSDPGTAIADDGRELVSLKGANS